MTNKLAIFEDSVVCRRFRVGVSLHSHTLHSQECLSFVDGAAKNSAVARWALRQGKAIYRSHTGEEFDLNSIYWTPPLAPHDGYTLEADQITALGMLPIVSLTDHDDINAGLTLAPLNECRYIPISFEWTVPYRETFFHLGLHNLPRRGLHETFTVLQAWRQNPELDSLYEFLTEIGNAPGTLVVFNHPFWDEGAVGGDLHVQRAKEFLSTFKRFVHALEINGMRPRHENEQILQLARCVDKPVIAGGDRHATEANVLINLTNAQTFAEFADEVRSGYSSILTMPAYREPLRGRVIDQTQAVLADYPHHARGWVKWEQRVFYTDQRGETKSLADWWQTCPTLLAVIVRAFGLLRRPKQQLPFRPSATPPREPLCWRSTD